MVFYDENFKFNFFLEFEKTNSMELVLQNDALKMHAN
jgi:hypothetical protein